MKKLLPTIIISTSLWLTSCMENYSNGERIGLVTQFSKRGMVWKSYEGHLNITQTGMNSADGFDFSIDRKDKRNSNQKTIGALDSAASLGWKVKVVYHQSWGRNWFNHRGETSHFIDSVIVIDKNFSSHNQLSNESSSSLIERNENNGRVVDTIYIVITPDDPNYKKFFK